MTTNNDSREIVKIVYGICNDNVILFLLSLAVIILQLSFIIYPLKDYDNLKMLILLRTHGWKSFPLVYVILFPSLIFIAVFGVINFVFSSFSWIGIFGSFSIVLIQAYLGIKFSNNKYMWLILFLVAFLIRILLNRFLV